MRRIIAFFFSILIILFSLSAENTTAEASMDITAYKSYSSTPLDTEYIIDVRPLVESELINYSVHDISNLVSINGSTATLENALKITLGANKKATNFYVTVVFSPFTSKEDSTIKIPVTYSYSIVAEAITTPVTSNYHYQYTPSLTISGTNGTTISNNSFTASITSDASIKMKWAISTIKRRKYNSTDWSNYNGINNNATLTGVTEEAYYPIAYAIFNLKVTSFTNMAMSVDYLAPVKITVNVN